MPMCGGEGAFATEWSTLEQLFPTPFEWFSVRSQFESIMKINVHNWLVSSTDRSDLLHWSLHFIQSIQSIGQSMSIESHPNPLWSALAARMPQVNEKQRTINTNMRNYCTSRPWRACSALAAVAPIYLSGHLSSQICD